MSYRDLILLCATFSSGCTLSNNDIRLALTSLTLVAIRTQSSLVELDAKGVDGVNSSLLCSSGGTAAYSGGLRRDVDRAFFDLRIRMSDCVENSVVMNGSVSFFGDLVSTAENTRVAQYAIIGTVSFGGGIVEGECGADISGQIGITPESVTVDSGGRLCARRVNVSLEEP